MAEETSYFDGVKVFSLQLSDEEKILIECTKKIDGQTVKSAYVLIHKKVSNHLKKDERIFADIEFQKILEAMAKRIDGFLRDREWELAKEASECLKAMFKTIAVVYGDLGFMVPYPISVLYEDTMQAFLDKIEIVDRKVNNVFYLNRK